MEKKAIQQKENDELTKNNKNKNNHKADKITRQHLLLAEERRAEERRKMEEEQVLKNLKITKQIDIQENINQINAVQKQEDIDRFGRNNIVDAGNLDQAVSSLSVLNENKNKKSDRHPEKRLKNAFADYQEKHLSTLRASNPTLKLSQIKEMLWKSWLKAPENPLNQINNSDDSHADP